MLPVVLLSHRGPASFRRTPSGLTVKRGAGGLVSALMGLAEHLEDAVWVCAAATAADAAVAAEHEGHSIEIAFTPEPELVAEDQVVVGPSVNVRYVEVDREQHRMFYSEIANPLLWFVQHGLYGRATEPNITAETHHSFEAGYLAVNHMFADAVADEVEHRGGEAIVMLQDYHFYLVGELVRERCPNAIISHFVHIPWPSPEGWRVLPPNMRDTLLRGLLGCDVVAFHTTRFARNFLACAAETLDCDVDFRAMTVRCGDRLVVARAYPISVDVEAVDKLAASEEVAAHRATLSSYVEPAADGTPGQQLIVRVDRTDPSKNIVRGFRAFGILLEEHPELLGRVTFLASLMPSRTDVPEYADYLAQVGGVVAEVNARHHMEGWQPIDLRLQEDLAFAVASYQLADVLVVNAVNDGMNLVAKEAVIVNQRDGVLLLSESTGAHEELGPHALTLHPFDLQQQADAMYEALTMPVAERRRLISAAADVVRSNDVERWLRSQLNDLQLRERRERPRRRGFQRRSP
ncbi:MAG TPA: trehalose-6-phosphate synthase [Mycobacteriales bacterium]|nr:trehalose-6-phosphate synthase [Mycobacteriales bacterium]